MSFDQKQRREGGGAVHGTASSSDVGRRSLTSSMPGSGTGESNVQMSALTIPADRWDGGGGERSVQMRDAQSSAWMDAAVRPDLESVHAAADHGVSGSGGALPYLDTIQRSFGRHDVSHVSAHVGGNATEGARAMGAQAYAVGDQVAFGGSPDLHTAAHEAAHVVQQRAGVHLKGGVGQVGDPYERHADAVADKVVRGESAEGLLDEMAGGSSSGGTSVQMISTYGGEWDANPYVPFTGGSLRGARIEITFTPGNLVVAPKIGLTQTITAQQNGAADFNMGDALEQGDRAGRANTAAQGGEGRHIDRMGERTNPLYGIDNPGDGERLGETDTSGGGNARFGHRNLVPGAAADVEPAWLFDRPALAWTAPNTLMQKFETTALVLEGPMTGTYLGSVEWGTQTDAAGTPTTMPFRVVSQGAPTQEFMTAVQNWNAAQVWMRERVIAPNDATVTSLAPLVAGTVYPINTLYMTLTPGGGGAAVEIRSPVAATFDGFLVGASAAVTSGQELAVYRTQQDTADMTTTTHVTVDPASLDDAALEQRMRALCDEILRMDRTSTDYQNKRFEIRGLGQVAVARGHDAVDSGHTYTVRGGDTLWGIAANHLGGGARWTRIMALNAEVLQDPNIIHAGRVLKMPRPYHP